MKVAPRAEEGGSEHALGSGQVRDVIAHDVRAPKQLGQLDLFDLELLRALDGEVRIRRDDFEAEQLQLRREAAPNPAHADDANGLALRAESLEVFGSR